MSARIKKIAIKDIKILGGRRSVKRKNVRVLADSMSKIGLNTPITVRKGKTGLILVAGLHRLEAAKLLGWKKIKTVQMSGGKTNARIWEDSENLHRAELTVLERADRIERWRKKTWKRASQVAGPGGRQPKDAGITKTAQKLGFSVDEVSRAKKISRISPKVKAKARKEDLADNQSALLAIAKAPTPKEQRAKLKAIVKRKNAPRRKRPTHPNTGKAELNLQIQENKKLKANLDAKRKKLRKLKNALAANGTGAMSIAPVTTSPPTVPTHDEAAMDISSPSNAPVQPDGSDNLELPPELDRRDSETAFVALKAAWDHAPMAVRSRFVAEVLGISGNFPGSQTEHP